MYIWIKNNFYFQLLRNLYTDFLKSYTQLHFKEKWISVLFFPQLHQKFLFFESMKMVILTEIRWNLTVLFIFISLMTENTQHFSMYLLSICISTSMNYFNCILFDWLFLLSPSWFSRNTSVFPCLMWYWCWVCYKWIL